MKTNQICYLHDYGCQESCIFPSKIFLCLHTDLQFEIGDHLSFSNKECD